MVTQLQLEIDSTIHRFLKEHAKQDGMSVEGLIIRLIERYKRDTDSPEVALRKVWDAVGIWGAISPDGRYLSTINWKTKNLAVRDLNAKETRDITSDGYKGRTKVPETPDRWAGYSTWSPDGKQVAYAWLENEHHELRIIGLDGSKPRILYRSEDMESRIVPWAWFQDGKSVVVGLYKMDGTGEILSFSVRDGSSRVLKSLEHHRSRSGESLDRTSLSPDGHYLVYTRSEKQQSENRGLFLLNIDDNSEEIPLTEDPDWDDSSPLWAPDGKTIVFTRNRSPMEPSSLWFTQVVDGKQIKEPQLVMKGGGKISPLGFTREGSLYYSMHYDPDKSDIYESSLDMETGEFLMQPKRVRSEGYNNSPSWSPDGTMLAYASMRPSLGNNGHGWMLVIRSMETGEEREILPEGGVYTTLSWTPLGRLRWSPDECSILYGGYVADIHLIDVQTGDSRVVVEAQAGVRMNWPVWSADGKAIYYVRGIMVEGAAIHYSIIEHDLTTGKERELHSNYSTRIFEAILVISPDGQYLAFVAIDEGIKMIKVIPTAGGEPRTLVSLDDPSAREKESTRPFTWTQDGRYLMYVSSTNHVYGPHEIWRHDLEGYSAQSTVIV